MKEPNDFVDKLIEFFDFNLPISIKSVIPSNTITSLVGMKG